MSLVLLVLAGFILTKNPEWFNGAETVGSWMFYGGLAVFAIELIIYAVIFTTMVGGHRRRIRKYKRTGNFR
jgi:hypothetical protein